MAEYKWLKGGVHFIGKLPTTLSGKIQRAKIQKLLAELYGKSKAFDSNRDLLQ